MTDRPERVDLDGPVLDPIPRASGHFGKLTSCKRCGRLTFWRTAAGRALCPKCKRGKS